MEGGGKVGTTSGLVGKAVAEVMRWVAGAFEDGGEEGGDGFGFVGKRRGAGTWRLAPTAPTLGNGRLAA